MQPIGMSLDTINSQSRLALGQANASSSSLVESLSMVSNFLPANSNALMQAAGFSTSVTPESAPTENTNMSSMWALLFANQAKSATGGEQNIYKLLATSIAVANTPGLDTTQTKTNLDISQFVEQQNKAKANNTWDFSAFNNANQSESKSVVPTQTPVLTVEEFSKDRSPTTNSLAPATVGTNFDLNYLHKLGDSMAPKDPVERMKSFGLDEHLIAPLMGLPGVTGGDNSAKLLSSISTSPTKTSDAEINKSLTHLDSMLDQAMGSLNSNKKADNKSSGTNPLLGGLEYASGGKVSDTVKDQTTSSTSKYSSKSDNKKDDDKKSGGLIDSFNGLVKDWLSPNKNDKDSKRGKGSLLDDQSAKPILVSNVAQKAKAEKEEKAKEAAAAAPPVATPPATTPATPPPAK